MTGPFTKITPTGAGALETDTSRKTENALGPETPPFFIEHLMNKHDKRLVQEALRKRWEEIDEDEAETEEGRQALHEIIARKYHHEEYLNDNI